MSEATQRKMRCQFVVDGYTIGILRWRGRELYEYEIVAVLNAYVIAVPTGFEDERIWFVEAEPENEAAGALTWIGENAR